MKYNYPILFVLMFGSVSLFAQTTEWAWANTGGGSSLDYGTSISVDAERNLYLTGWFNSDTISFCSIVLTNNGKKGTSDLFIAKYDPLGTFLWVKKFGGSGEDKGTSIKTGSNGDFVLTGWFKSPSLIMGETTLKNAGGSEIGLGIHLLGNAEVGEQR